MRCNHIAISSCEYSPDGGMPASQNKGNASEIEVKEEPMSLASSSQQLSDVAEASPSDDTGSVAGMSAEAQTRNQVLEALKSRIRELETETRAAGDEKFKCLICMVSTIARYVSSSSCVRCELCANLLRCSEAFACGLVGDLLCVCVQTDGPRDCNRGPTGSQTRLLVVS